MDFEHEILEVLVQAHLLDVSMTDLAGQLTPGLHLSVGRDQLDAQTVQHLDERSEPRVELFDFAQECSGPRGVADEPVRA